MKRKLLVLLLITGSLFAQTFEQRYGLLQVPSIFKRLGTTVSTVGATDNVSLYTLALGGATIGANALAVNGPGYFSGDVNIGAVGTSARLLSVTNTGGDFYFARERSIGTAFASNSLAYAAIFAAAGTYPIQFSVNATVAMTILDGGSTFIGYTADPTSGNKFAVSGNSYFNGTTTSTGAFLAPTNSAVSPSYSFTSDPNSGMYSVSADQLGLSVNGSNMVTVTTTGVGIGTTGPTAKLDVRGANGITDSFGNMYIASTDVFAIDKGGYLTFGGGYGSGISSLFAGIAGRKENVTDGNNAGYLSLSTTTASSSLAERMRITSTGNVGIGTSTPLHKTSIASPTTANYFYGLNIVNANINKTRTTIVQSTDTADVNIKISTLGNPQFMMKGATGNTIFLVDSSATSLGNALTLLDPGTSANSYAITLTADNATTPQLAQLYNAYGASPYIVVAPSNGAGTPTPAIYIHSDAMNFIDSYSLTTNTADDDNVIFKAVDNDDNVLYEVARLTGAATPTFDLLAGRLTGALNANSQDISSVNALGAVSLTLTGAFTGSSLTDGNDTFTTTATADTVTISGASVNDRYYGNYTTAVTAAESPLSIVATATGFIATRPIGTTSDAAYNWFRIKH